MELYNNREKDRLKGLIFEYVVPLNIIKQQIIDMFDSDATVDEVVVFLRRQTR